MKKILLFIFVLQLTSLLSFAQTGAKPTKEQTMDWIGTKFKERLTGARNFVSYSGGVFTYYKDMHSTNGTVMGKYLTSIDLNKVTGISDEYSSLFFVSGKNLISTKCQYDKPSYQEVSCDQVTENLALGGVNYKDFTEPFNLDAEAGLKERMRKAMLNLIDYNKPKKGADEPF